VHTFSFNKSGTAVTDNRPLLTEEGESMTFTQPLDVAVHPSGRIYVADFGNWSSFGGGGSICLLSPHGGE
jgi:sugar lactone lactonase YvrE